MEEIKTSSEIADNSILVDTNVIISMLGEYKPPLDDTLTKIKMAAITCENFLVLEHTIEELQRYFSSNEKQSARDFENYLNRKIFKVVTRDDLNKAVDWKGAEGISETLSKKPLGAQGTDITLLLTSKAFSIPIFTYDLEIIRLANSGNGSVISELSVPFPFDSEELRNISLDEIVDTSAPFRQLYKKTFNKIKDDVSTIDNLEKNLEDKDEFIKKQAGILLDLNSELLVTKESLQKWQNFAKPNLGETIIWTIVELGLGFVPFPVPTSPVNHFIQSVRYKNIKHRGH